jgi:hypothetical protein
MKKKNYEFTFTFFNSMRTLLGIDYSEYEGEQEGVRYDFKEFSIGIVLITFTITMFKEKEGN